jgi:hypothetical protein
MFNLLWDQSSIVFPEKHQSVVIRADELSNGRKRRREYRARPFQNEQKMTRVWDKFTTPEPMGTNADIWKE